MIPYVSHIFTYVSRDSPFYAFRSSVCFLGAGPIAVVQAKDPRPQVRQDQKHNENTMKTQHE